MCIIMLNKSLTSNIPNFDALILRSTSKTSSVWMELDRVDSSIMILEWVDELSRCEIPQLNSSILRPRCNQPRIRTKSTCLNPMIMCLNRKEELSIWNIGYSQLFIIATREEHLTIGGEADWSDCALVVFDDLGMSFDRVIPETDCVILGTRCDDVALWWYFNIVDCTLMSNKSKWSHRWFEVPYHHSSILRTRYNLFQIWIKSNFIDLFFMPLKWSLECWITSWCNVTLFIVDAHIFIFFKFIW